MSNGDRSNGTDSRRYQIEKEVMAWIALDIIQTKLICWLALDIKHIPR